MKRKYIVSAMLALAAFSGVVADNARTVKLRILQTSDVHGNFFPYNFVERKPSRGSMARISSYVQRLRGEYGRNLILLDNGDIMQGQPVNYYSNYVADKDTNIVAKVLNYMCYDAAAFGNHDVETGHHVYDKMIRELNCPLLAANVVNTATDSPYVTPYVVFERDGVKIAVLGLLTPAIPNWLDEKLWSGMRFEPIVEAARKWIKIINEKEKPDVVVGLLHSGWDGGITTSRYSENAARATAESVDGFDVIFFGHDHRKRKAILKDLSGRDVLCLDPTNSALNVSDVQVELTVKEGRVTEKKISGEVHDICNEPVDEVFVKRFSKETDEIAQYVSRNIGVASDELSTRDCFFGNSAFTDIVLNMELELTGADVAFNAPLQFDAKLSKGPILMGDMFKLYRFENKVCVLRMTGEEIRKHLEMSYDQWVNTMKTENDHVMLLNDENATDMQRFGFKYFTFNFDSAAGIDYEVDVTKPDGHKVRILRMSNGSKFDPKRTYRVAMNSYRANGGGELLTKGAGISLDELPQRKEFESSKDLRQYLAEYIQKKGSIGNTPNSNWRFVPEKWTKPASERDRKLIFRE